jgi:glycosyltransferase involved in cell wall biosynthesis
VRRPELLVDARWSAATPTRDALGIGRFAREVLPRLPAADALDGGLPLLHRLEPLWLAAVLAHRRPHVYFSPGFNAPAWSPVPIVFCIQDLIHLTFEAESSTAKRAYYRSVVRPAGRRARAVCTASRFARDEVQAWLGEKACVVAVGAGVGSEFTPQGSRARRERQYLLYVGNRKPHKNLHRLLEAFARSGLASEAALVLTGPPDPATAAHARRLAIDRQVEFIGDVTDSELAALYRGALATALPSLYEGFGLPALESMACGTPVVGSNVTAVPEVVGDAGLLVDPTDADGLADALRRVVEDEELRRVCRERGLRRARAYTWEATAASIGAMLGPQASP